MEEWGQIDKPLRDLIEIIHFTENVSAKIHGLLDEAEIYRSVKREFAQSKRYTASILLLTDDGSALRVAETSALAGKLKAIEKAAGLRLREYEIDLNKSSTYSQVIREGETIQVNASDILAELLPQPLARLVSEAMGYEKRPAILTPLKRHGKIIGALAMTSTELAEHFIPSVRNLAQHVSIALELADEYAERKRAEGMLRESEEKFRNLAEQSPNMIFINKKGKVVYANEQCEEIMGYKREELYSPDFDFFTLIAPEHIDLIKANFRRHMEGEDVLPYEYALITKEGRRIGVIGTPKLISYEGESGILGIVTDITARKRAEEEIRKLSQFQERIIDNAGTWLDVLDAEANIVIWNKAAEEISGYSREEVVGHDKIWEWLYPDEEYRRQVLGEAIAIIEEGEEERGGETTIRCKDGHTKVISWNSQSLVDEKGSRIGSIALGHDVTERKRAEEALRESEEKYRNLVERANDGIIIAQEGLLQYVNPRSAEIWGGPVEEMLGTPFIDYVHPDELSKMVDRYRRRMAGEDAPPIYETVLKRKDGSDIYVELNAGVITYQGKPADLVFIRDITERKRAERLLQTLNEAALAMGRALTPEEIFTAAAEKLKKIGFLCAIFLADESQSRLFPTYLSHKSGAIKAAEKLTGLKRKDFSIPIEAIDMYKEIVRGKKAVLIEDVGRVARQWLPGYLSKFAAQVVKMLKVSKSIAAPLIVEDKVIGLLSVQSADLAEDDIPAVTAFAHQMAAAWRKAQLMQDLQNGLEELKRTQAQLLQAQKMEAIGQLAGGICHDFNNLLTPISGFAELLLWKAAEGSEQQEYLRQIKVAAERAAALTRQLRLFTRQAAGERHPVQLNSVVEETYDLLGRSISKEIAIELNLSSDLRVVEVDPSQIGQVLMNLCLNACDAMLGGGTLTLETRNVTLDEEYARQVLAAQPGHYVCLSVSDTGIGMSPQVQARLFEPFFTTKEVGKGTGLGLAVGYGIVKGHGGFIQVYSEVGRGSTFHVYLPAIGLLVEERKAEGLELPTGTETILLVDDEETVRALGQRVLERCGYTVLMAEDGVRAVEVYRAHREEIALVVLDVVMPEMGGLECLRRLRAMDPRVKVLISTGYTAKNLAQELVTEGALGVVEKPFLLQDFATALRTAIDE